MEYILEWKCMKSTDYVMGIFPTTNHGSGKKFERDNGTIKYIKPFEQKKLGVTITIIDGDSDLVEFKKKFSRCDQNG
jgi:hypothetical protein